jgi:hypothetical protein
MWPDSPVIFVSAHPINPGEGIHHRAFVWLRKPYASQEWLETRHAAVRTAAVCNEAGSVMDA